MVNIRVVHSSKSWLQIASPFGCKLSWMLHVVELNLPAISISFLAHVASQQDLDLEKLDMEVQCAGSGV